MKEMLLRHPVKLVIAAALLAIAVVSLRQGWVAPWITPDMRGSWLMRHGRFADAADVFLDPMWRGVALMKAGAFKEALGAFSGIDTAEAAYDQGSALVMLGKYDDAVGRYDRALALRPGWSDATANREIARLRAEMLRTKGGTPMGGDEDTPDAVVFEKAQKPDDGTKDQEAGGDEMSDAAIRALWLRRVHARPADFLRVRFAYQLQSAPP